MKCVWTQKVSLLIDGELAREEAREVERHVEACGDCREAREDFLLLRRQIASYRLDLDAFAERRALKHILAGGGNNNAAKAEHKTAAAPARRRYTVAGMFGMPRLSPVGLAALLLLVFGVAVGVVSLLNSRRQPAEIAKTNAPHAPSAATANNNSTADAQTAPPTVPNNAAPDSNKQDGGASVAENNPKQAGAKLTGGAKTGAAAVQRRNAVQRTQSAGHKVPKSSPNFNRTRVDAPVAESARNDVEAVDSGVGAGETGDDAAARSAEVLGAAGESKTARHVEQAQMLLRSFRNARPAERGSRASSDLAYDKQRSKKLLYQNIVLRREAASRGNLPVESLLDSLEPILIDIANLPDRPAPADVRVISERMRRQNLVAMLQISAVESASARHIN
ncbi:MAG TPA: zf-HC2 domain-containing protein [Pyrinomonadaceae bacterium]|nr:zf-HC2 domain-containing protein [Pyrinomonadaceae bacterium]